MAKETASLVASVQDHLNREWAMLEEMIGNIPEEEWRQAGSDGLCPAHHVVHVVIGADVFVRDIPFDRWDPTGFWPEARPGGPWNMAPEELWSKQVALRKLAEMRAIVERRLAELDDEALLEAESVHPWTGRNRLGKMLYELRHIQHHLGEISSELRRRGIVGFERWD
jgi:hypothetical protein